MNETQEIPIEQIESEVRSAMMPVIEQSRALTVTSAETYSAAVRQIQILTVTRKNVIAQFRPSKDAAKLALAKIKELEDKILVPLEAEENDLRDRASTWHKEQARISAEETARLNRIANEKAERERAALAAKASAMKTEAKRAEYLARAAEVVAPVVQVQSEAPKAEGISYVTRWKYRVKDEALIPRQWLCVDDSKLSKYAVAMHNSVPVPGIEFYCERTMSVRTK